MQKFLKYLQTKFNNTFKGSYTKNKWGLTKGCKDGSINMTHHINKIKDKNYIIFSIDADRTFDKIQHPVMIKKKQKTPLSAKWYQFISQSCPTLRPHEPQHTRPPCPSPTPGVYSNSCPLSRWCHPIISSSVIPFSSCPQSFPESGSFQMSQLFAWGGQRIGVFSFNISPTNEHRGLICFRIYWLDLLAVQGTLKSSPAPQFKSINSLVLSFLYSPTLYQHNKGHMTSPQLTSYSVEKAKSFCFKMRNNTRMFTLSIFTL